jgi:DNA helicase-2/ATP-dependent DNA helicase PcrA
MTVHAAKGLEFPHVILCGMNEGIFPSRKISTLSEMEEERRLAFVAMTRAEKALYLTMSDGRNIDGSPRYPSRFVLDIDQDLIDYTAPPDEGLIKETRDYIKTKDRLLDGAVSENTFKPGDRIVHFIFGPGQIVDIDAAKKAWVIQFDDMPTPRQVSWRAKIERSGDS